VCMRDAEISRLKAEVERLRRRAPTQQEAEDVSGVLDTVFIDGWTCRRCRLCRRWVFGGPTACEQCIATEERDQSSADCALLRTEVAKREMVLAKVEADLAEEKKLRELAETEATASKQAEWKCCSRNAWGDGEHDKDCPFARTLKNLGDADDKCAGYAKALREMMERAEKAEADLAAAQKREDARKAWREKYAERCETRGGDVQGCGTWIHYRDVLDAIGRGEGPK
jgi:hypothetical protein